MPPNTYLTFLKPSVTDTVGALHTEECIQQESPRYWFTHEEFYTLS